VRRIFVGDIQGCHDEFSRLLDRVQFEPSKDRLYSVGDAVNRGPDSAAVVRKLRDLQATMVLGNHELHLFEILAGRRQPRGRDTLASFLEAEDRQELSDWLLRRPVLHCEPDLILVHAGLHPAWNAVESKAEELRCRLDRLQAAGLPYQDEELRFAVSVRFCDATGRLAGSFHPPPEPPYQPWDSFYRGDRRVVFGHWAQRGLVLGERVRGLDSGCVYGNELTAWIAEEDRIVQVAARKAYCPTRRSPR
jgi:bis(5'-nucleosyl)-tetraphosphatase (symmetrical)